MRTEIMVHGARPVAHRSGASLWLTVHLAAPPIPLESAPTATLFFDEPETALALGHELVRQAQLAEQHVAIERDAGRTRQAVAG